MVGYTHGMVIVADSRRRVTLPKSTAPGDAFEIEAIGDEQFVLSKLKKRAPKIRLRRKNGLLVATSGRRITMEQTRAAMDEFP
jgi:hypothetical protein